MPRGFPPTPAPSTDIVGKDRAGSLHSVAAFDLPPSAYARGSPSSDNGNHAALPPHSLPSPTSPNAIDARKMSIAGQLAANHADITLPPPPTRTRKIIQMKPGQAPKKNEPEPEPLVAATKAGSGAAAAAGGKKKAAAGTSAGRKIARKTAHSLIERRRRSKMNEEFGVLKDMIPACAGQEMHKLAILQASIDYLRYLEQCVTDLKAGKRSIAAAPSSVATSRSHSMQAATPIGHNLSEEDVDEEMEDSYEDTKRAAAAAVEAMRPMTASSAYSRPSSAYASPAFSAHHGYNGRPSAIELPSPRVDTFYAPHGQPVYSRYGPPSTFSVATPPTFSNHASPMMLPQPNGGYSNHASPMILPQPSTALDHEASAALLMLNASDRRLTSESSKSSGPKDEPSPPRPATQPTPHSRSTSGVRGMSVQDLLRN